MLFVYPGISSSSSSYISKFNQLIHQWSKPKQPAPLTANINIQQPPWHVWQNHQLKCMSLINETFLRAFCTLVFFLESELDMCSSYRSCCFIMRLTFKQPMINSFLMAFLKVANWFVIVKKEAINRPRWTQGANTATAAAAVTYLIIQLICASWQKCDVSLKRWLMT